MTQPPARQGPGAALRVHRPFPQQHAELRLRRAQVTNLEHDGQHFVLGATIWHVFDYKSSAPRREEAVMAVADRVDELGVEHEAEWAEEVGRRAGRRGATQL